MRKVLITEKQLRFITEGDWDDAMRSRVLKASKRGEKGSVQDFVDKNKKQADFDVMLKQAREGKKGKANF